VTAPTCSLSIGDGIGVGNPFGIYATHADLTERESLVEQVKNATPAGPFPSRKRHGWGQ